MESSNNSKKNGPPVGPASDPNRLDLQAMDPELRRQLALAQGKPMHVAITFLDGKKLQHWQKVIDDFKTDDILPSLLELGRAAERDLIPAPLTVIKGLQSPQTRARKGR